MTNILASCHCQNLSFELDWPKEIISARKCACNFCVKHNASWASHVDAKLIITISNQSLLSKYKFGTNTADFYLCTKCGVPLVAISEINNKEYAVVNVNTINNFEQLSFSESTIDFADENKGNRLERRMNNWISDVTIMNKTHN